MTQASTPVAADSIGPNPGTYHGGPTAGVAGALTGDADTAVQFDGVNDYVQATGTTGMPTGAGVRSVEAWFKTTSSAQQVLFSYGSLANTQEFGLWLDTGGAAMTAWGYGTGNDKTFTLAAAVNNGAWHHVVKTYDGTSITLYVDGVALTPQTATRSTVMDAYGFGIGAMHHARRLQHRQVLHRHDRRGLVLHHRAGPDDSDEPLPARHQYLPVHCPGGDDHRRQPGLHRERLAGARRRGSRSPTPTTPTWSRRPSR